MDKKKKSAGYWPSAVIVLLVCILVGVISTQIKVNGIIDNQGKNFVEDSERFYLYTDFYEAAKQEDIDLIKEQLKGSDVEIENIFNESFFRLNGKSIDDFMFTSDEISYSPLDFEGPICIEVIADWCQYSQYEVEYELDYFIENHPECTFIQYVSSGGKEQANAFYSLINKKPNEKLIISYNNLEFAEFLESIDVSFPSMIFVNKEHKITGMTSGVLFDKYFDGVYKVCNTVNTYDLETVNGEKFNEVLDKLKFAREYIGNLEYIDIPKKELKYGK